MIDILDRKNSDIDYLMQMHITLVSIIEDHDVIRNHVSKYLGMQSDFEMHIVATSVENFFEAYNKTKEKSHVLLLDIGLPGKSGLEAIPELLEAMPELEIIMLTTYEEESTILKALCSGASAYLSKKSSLAEIANTVRIVKDGGSYMSPSIAREIVDHLVGGMKSKATILSNRQREILEMMVEGMSYKDISKKLFISLETVRSHIKKMYKVLHVNNKAQAISKYLKGEIK